jgi:hypothetical protein
MNEVIATTVASAKSLATYSPIPDVSPHALAIIPLGGTQLLRSLCASSSGAQTDLGDPTNVFGAVRVGEAQVLVKAEADIVAVQAVRSDPCPACAA